MQLSLISWNMNRNNIFLNNALEQLLHNNYDVIFLQEVNYNNLDFIRNKFSSYLLFTSKEIIFSWGSKIEYYLVTLVKSSIVSSQLSYKSSCLNSKRTFIYKLFNRRIYIEYNKVVLHIKDKLVTLLNVHLQCACSPGIRKMQLDSVFNSIDTECFILGGDLNFFSRFPLSIFIGFVLDYRLSDYMLDEGSAMLNSSNVISGKMLNTSIYHTGKLDWILLSKNIEYLDEYVLPRFGSDHYPLVVKCEV